MRYWWVNQKQTYRHEVPGGYLWSPKRKTNGHANAFYDFMREIAPGDVVFSYADGLIKAIGIAASYAYEAPKPLEFGQSGAYWNKIGWRVDVRFIELKSPAKPAEHMAQLEPHLPKRYAPLQSNGQGLQSVYLTLLPDSFAEALVDVLGREARNIVHMTRVSDVQQPPVAIGLIEWEEHELRRISQDDTVPETTRKAVVMARRGQGVFKQNVLKHEAFCRITRVDQIEHLRASHCKPWRDSTNEERLDGTNGLLLTPTIDHLFDRGFIAFEDGGKVLISPVVHRESLRRMGIDPDIAINAGAFSQDQRKFLRFHRESVFLESKFKLTP